MLRMEQVHQVQSVYNACLTSGHEFLLELIPPRDAETGFASDDQTLVRSMERFYKLGVRPDWWKVPSPSRSAWLAIESLLQEKAPHCRGVILHLQA